MDEVPIHLHIELLPEGVYLATSPDVPGLVVQADTIAEAIEFAQGCTLALLQSAIEHGDPIPRALMPLAQRLNTDKKAGIKSAKPGKKTKKSLDLIIPVGAD